MEQEHERTYTEADLLAAFHSHLSREEAEALLVGQPAGTFLVRESQHNPATTDPAHQKDSSTSALLVLSYVAGTGGSPGEAGLRCEHTQVKLRTMAKVEGFFFVRQPGRVRPSLYALLNRMSAFRFPLRASAPSIAAAAISANEDRIESTTGSPLLGLLVDELLLAVLAHLSPFDLVLLSLVCKQLYVLSKDDTIWRHKYCSEFGAWVPPVQCNPTNGLSWKLKYWLEYNLFYRSPVESTPFVFSRLEAEAKEPQNNETFVRYSDTHPNALVLSHKILTEDSDPFGFGLSANTDVGQGKSLVFRVQCGDNVGYSLHQYPKKPCMVHSSLASLVRAARNFPQWSVVRSTPLLCQLRLAALGHIRELVFVSSTPREWHLLASVVTADPPHLRSLVVRASYALSAITRSVLQRIATANQSLRCLCLRGLGDLNEIPDIIRQHPGLRVLALDIKSHCTPGALHALLEALAHSGSLQRVTINFRAAAAGSVAPLGQSLNFSTLPDLLRACGLQVVKVGIYGVPAPIKAQIDQAVAQRPDRPKAAAVADHHVRLKVVTTPAKPWRSPYSAASSEQQQPTCGAVHSESVGGQVMADTAYVSGLDPSARQYQFDDMLTRWRHGNN